jgi:fructose-bisphosphate aldolase class II
MTLIDGGTLVERARAGSFAIAAFNASNLETTQGILRGAEATASPVILQLSPGALAYAGYPALTRLVFAAAEDAAVEVAVHLDHCRDLAVIERALGDGFGSVMFDGSLLDDALNATTTATVVGWASRATARGTDVQPAVEAELGVIAGSESTDLETARAGRAAPERCRWFVAATGLDILAPAIGNLHRMLDDSVELDLGHLAAVSAAARVPLALHGGSGVVRSQLPEAIAAGVAKVNLSSRVGQALAAGIRGHWAAEPDDRDLRRYMGRGRDAVADLAREYFILTGSAGRASGQPGSAADPAATATAASAPIPTGIPIPFEPE